MYSLRAATADFWQARPPEQRPHPQHAPATATAFYSTKSRQGQGHGVLPPWRPCRCKAIYVLAKNFFLKSTYVVVGPNVKDFNFSVILYLFGINFHAVVDFGLGKNFFIQT